MTTINGVPRELIERAIKDEQSWPRLDGNWACVGCGNWMPKGHPEAHEHEEGCQEEALAKQRHWRSQLRALLAEQPQAGAGQHQEGFVLVPIERSYEMRAAAFLHYNTAKKEGKDHDDALDAAWRGMLAKSHGPDGRIAAPQPPARHDQGNEVRRLREALTKVGNRLEAFIADEMDMPHDSMEVCKGIIDAALTHSQQGAEE